MRTEKKERETKGWREKRKRVVTGYGKEGRKTGNEIDKKVDVVLYAWFWLSCF